MRSIVKTLGHDSGGRDMSCRKECSKRFSFVLTLLALTVLVTPAFAANNCLQDEFSLQQSQSLNCTAGDVKVAKVINIRGLDGLPLTTCNSGAPFTFVADFLVQTSSQSSRSNVGLYFSLNDVNVQPTALTGTCSDNIISPAHTCAGGTATCGSSFYEEFDTSTPGDNCGDTSSSDPTVCLDSSNRIVTCPSNGSTPPGGSRWTGTQIITARIDNFPCVAPQGKTQLVLPNCTSWQVPGKTLLCQSPSPDYPYNANAIPGSPSKCNCATIPLGITPQSPGASVTKRCTTGSSSGLNTSCDLFPEGGQVVYTVSVTNNSNFGDIVVDQICDDQYGSIFTKAGFTPACPAGTAGSKGTYSGTTTCGAMTISAGSSQSCTFTVTQAEDVTVTDKVTVKGHGSVAGTFGPTDSNSVQVVSHEAPSTATITKGLVSTTAGCATARYEVEFKNTSAANTDETIHLSAPNDNSFGDLTQVHGNVLGTTCGVATNSLGLGTLSGSNGAGTLPVTLAVNGGKYTCRFDGQFCSAVGTIVSAPGTCTNGSCSSGLPNTTQCTQNSDCDVHCNGIQHINTVTATVTDDDGEAHVVTLTPGTLTVSECFTSSAN